MVSYLEGHKDEVVLLVHPFNELECRGLLEKVFGG